MNKPSSNRIWPGLTYVGVPYVAGKTDMELTVTATSMSGVIANVRPLSLALDEDGPNMPNFIQTHNKKDCLMPKSSTLVSFSKCLVFRDFKA